VARKNNKVGTQKGCKPAMLVLLLLLVSGYGRVVAQSYYVDDRTFYGGLIAGANFTQVDGDNFAGYHKTGFNLGGIVYSKLDEHMAIGMEVLYVQKGARSKGFFTVAPGKYITDYGITLNYAQVPILLSYFDNHKNHFGVGAAYSRLGTAKEYIKTVPADPIDLNQFPFKKSDYSFLINGSLHCWKGLFLNMRFEYSLLSVRNHTPQNYSRGQQFNNVMTLRLMYLFI
jgi:hypothetical protein